MIQTSLGVPWSRALAMLLYDLTKIPQICYFSMRTGVELIGSAVSEAMSDIDLVHAIAGGDREALSALYERFGSLMLSASHRILGNKSEAEEVLHDVFLEVWKKAGDYNSARGKVKTWLLVRVRSRSLDRCKSVGRKRAVPLDDAKLSQRISKVEKPDLASDRLRVRGALKSLPDKQRKVLTLSYFKGMSSSEVSKALGIPIGTVKSRAASGLVALRRALADGSEGER